MSVTRFPFGVTNANFGTPLAELPQPDVTKLGINFFEFTGQDYIAAQWTVTETDAASTQGMVAASASGEYGLLALVQAGTGATAVNSIQLTTAGIFLGDTTKRWWLEGKVSRDNADEGIGFGVQAVNTTPFTVADGIWVNILGASTDAVFRVTKGSASTTATATAAYPTSGLDTFVTLGMAYDGLKEVQCFVNGALQARISVLTNLPNTAALTPTIAALNTTANARNVHVDRFLFAVER